MINSVVVMMHTTVEIISTVDINHLGHASISPLCLAAQSLYKPTVSTAHGRISLPVVPCKSLNGWQGCARSAGGLIAVGNGLVKLLQPVSIKAIPNVDRLINNFLNFHISDSLFLF